MVYADRLSFRYSPGRAPVLEELSFHAGRGEYVSIVGENGCGKSTLVRLLLGLLKPSAGSVRIAARRTGYLPQKKDFLEAQFPITVREALDSYRSLLHIKDKGIVKTCLERVSMEGVIDRLLGTLSGGQAQRVFIARALIGSPDLLFLDEPSSGVDRQGQKEMYSLIAELNRREGITVVSVEHNLEAAVNYSSLIFHLAEGRGHFCDPETYAAEYLHSKREAVHA
jgi:zinc transport system ATP-binding protein